MQHTDSVEVIKRLTIERAQRSDASILDELRALDPLPDEQDEAAWDLETTWQSTHLLIALAQQVATRRLEAGVGLILDKMCFGDPFEVMRGMRHKLEAAVVPDWRRLAEICISRCSSDRAGTRYWAVDELGILRDPSALPAVLAMFSDREPRVAVNAFRAASMTLQQHPRLRGAVMRALQEQVRSREVLRDDALDTIRQIQLSGPVQGKVQHAEAEAFLAKAVAALRDGTEPARISFGFQWLLMTCLNGSDERDLQRAPDGLVDVTATFSERDTLDVYAQMVCLDSTGQTDCTDPFHASVTIDGKGTTIIRAVIEYGDATKGIGAVRWGSRGIDPRTVTNWLFRFEK